MVSVATWSGAPGFMVVSTNSFLPSVHAIIFSIAFTTLRSHDPQLSAPRTMPPAVGWDFTWALRSLVLSRTSTTDHNQGGRYSPRRNSRSTIVRLWTFTGLSETVSLYGSASC